MCAKCAFFQWAHRFFRLFQAFSGFFRLFQAHNDTSTECKALFLSKLKFKVRSFNTMVVRSNRTRTTNLQAVKIIGYPYRQPLFYACRFPIIPHWVNYDAKRSIATPSPLLIS